MAEKKVATRQERLMFEKMIQNDRQYPNRKEYQSEGSNEMMPRSTPQNQQYNKEQQIVSPYETHPGKKETPVVLRQPPVNRRNIGKRDAVWEAKRQRKIELIMEIAQRGGLYPNERSKKDAYPRDNCNVTPQDPLPKRTPINQGYEQDQRRTPMNNQQYEQQQRQTPINQQKQQIHAQGRTPINNQGYGQEQSPNRTPPPQNNMQGRTPMQGQYNQGNSLIINEQPNRTPMNPNNNQPQGRTPVYDNNNQINKTPKNPPSQEYERRTPMDPRQDYQNRTPINQSMGNPQQQQQVGRLPQGYGSNNMYNLMGQSHSYQNRTPMNNNQDMRATPQYQYERDNMQGKVPTPYQQPGGYGQPIQKTPMNNQPTPNKNYGDQLGPQYYEQENYDRNYQMQRQPPTPQQYSRGNPQQQYPEGTPQQQQYLRGTPQQQQYPNGTPQHQYGNGTPQQQYQGRTPQQQYPPNRTPQYQNQNNMTQTQMRGSRTPFTDSQGNPSYKPSGSFYGQSHTPNLMPNNNRPPSRPFDNVSFKDQQGGYPKQDNYYPNRNQQQPYY